MWSKADRTGTDGEGRTSKADGAELNENGMSKSRIAWDFRRQDLKRGFAVGAPMFEPVHE